MNSSKGKTVALVLGSGGARGYAHIGAIEVLQERGYEIIAIAGCSIGAMVGGVYAAGKLTEFKDWATGLDQLDVLKLVDFSLTSPGAIRGNRVFSFVRELLGDTNIENLPIPYTAVATDLLAHKEIWFQEGPLHQAIRASVAIPSLMAPVILGERLLVDGGLLNPLPIFPTISSHADLIVAVNLGGESGSKIKLRDVYNPHESSKIDQWMGKMKTKASSLFDKESTNQVDTEGQLTSAGGKTPEITSSAAIADEEMQNDFEIAKGGHRLPFGMIDIMNLSFEAMQNALTQYKLAGYPPDVLVNVPKNVCKTFDYHKAPELIQLGRVETEKALLNFEERST